MPQRLRHSTRGLPWRLSCHSNHFLDDLGYLSFCRNVWNSDVAHALTVCSMVACLFDDIQTASRLMNKCKAVEKSFNNLIAKIYFHFCDGLIASSLAKKVQEKDDFIKNISENIEKFELCSGNSTCNFLNKFYLLKAELAAIENEQSQAKTCCQKATSLSRKYRFLVEEAVALERAAHFYSGAGLEQDAMKLLFQSYNCLKE